MWRRVQPILAAALAATPVVAVAQPAAIGTISIVTGDAGAAPDAAVAPFVDALSATLVARGFTMFPDPGHAAFVARLRVVRVPVGTGRGRVPGQRKAQVAGTGVVLPLSTGQSELVPLLKTQMSLAVRRRGAQAPFWSASAVTVRQAGARDGGDAAVGAALANALLAAYPYPVRGEIGVP